MGRRVFISHSSKDAAIVGQIVAALERKGISCWVAPRDIPPGSSYPAEIIRAIRETELVILVFTRHSNASSHVAREIERATSLGKPILPYRVEAIPPSNDLDFLLGGRHWLDAGSGTDANCQDQLANAASRLLTGTAAAAVPTSAPTPIVKRKYGFVWMAAIGLVAIAVLAWRMFPMSKPSSVVVPATQLQPSSMQPSPALANLGTLGEFHRSSWKTWDRSRCVVARGKYSEWMDRFVETDENRSDLQALRANLVAAPPAVNPENPQEQWHDFLTLGPSDFDHLAALQVKTQRAAVLAGKSRNEAQKHFVLENLPLPE